MIHPARETFDIILKNRKVLRYNNANNVSISDDVLTVNDHQEDWIAKIPLANIERVEAIKPCKVLKDRPAPKKATY